MRTLSRPALGAGAAPPNAVIGMATASVGHPSTELRVSPRGTKMPADEWHRTSAIRRELVESMGHYEWSKGTDADRDERVRAEVSRRAKVEDRSSDL